MVGWVLDGPLSFPLPAPRVSLLLPRRVLLLPWRTRQPRLLLLLAPSLLPPCCLARTVRAAVDVDTMREAEQRALLARLVDLQAAR